MAAQPAAGARARLIYAQRALGCVASLVLPLAFYGSIAIVFLALVAYPFIYAQDVSSANAYKAAPLCGEVVANDCRGVTSAVVSNVRSPDGQPEFDIVLDGRKVTVTKDSGTYSPQNGDSVRLETWRGKPVRVTGPGGADMNTDQFPESLLKTDQDVLGVFLFIGSFCLVIAVLIGWFGRRIVFARLMGYSRPQILGGVAIALVILVVSVPVAIVGEASGWLQQGRGGGIIVGLVASGVVVLVAVAYQLIRRRRSA